MRGASWLGVSVLFLLPTLTWGQAKPPVAALQTVAERSGYQATARHDELIALCQTLDARSDLVTLTELGKSTQGRSIPLLLVANPPVKTAEEAEKSGKLVVMALGNIHAGEVDGKEALPMLVRELTDTPDHPLLKDVILAVVPNYNPDGNEQVAKDNRPGQVGPVEGMGKRENGQGFDLNRDFVKLEAPETQALVRWVNAWNPHVLIDCHTTNGSFHRYTITHAGPRHPGGDQAVVRYAGDRLLPAIDRAMTAEHGWKTFVYGNFENNHGRWTTYGAEPRFGTSYLGLRNRIGILSEGYAYAPYKDRVLATRDFVQEILEAAVAQKAELIQVLNQAAQGGQIGEPVAIRSELKPRASKVSVLGYVEPANPPTGGLHPTEPQDYTAEVWDQFAPRETVARPAAYLLPAGFPQALELLQRHGLPVQVLREDLELPIEAYTVTGVERAKQPFQGHTMITDVAVSSRREPRMVKAGSLLVPATGSLGSLAVMLLEPRSEDGLVAWNGFDDALRPGAEFPVLRVPALPTYPLLTAAVKPAFETGRPSVAAGGASNSPALRVGSGLQVRAVPGAAGFVKWLDETHFAQTRDGKTYKVEAVTGQAEILPPEPTVDRSKLAKGLAALPEIEDNQGEALAGRARFNAGGAAAFVEHDGDLYYGTLDGTTARRLTTVAGAEELAEFSPDGRYVSFVRKNDLYVVEVATGTERALTTGGTDRIRHGKCDWVYFEEIFNRNWKAYWWSPNSQHLAFFKIDDRMVPNHHVLIETGDPRVVEETAYPRAGEPNPQIQFGIVAVQNGEPKYADLSSYDPANFLMSDAGWWPDGSMAYFYGQDRSQTWLDVLKVPVSGGTPTKLFRETTGAWVESLGPIQVLKDGSLLVQSERDGFKHLYLYNSDGTLKNRITTGDWEVRQVVKIDEPAGWVYLAGTKDDALGLGLSRARLDGSALESLTQGPGTHTAMLSPGGGMLVDIVSSRQAPPRALLAKTDGTKLRDLDTNPVDSTPDPDAPQREIVQIKARDGFVLEAEVLLPPHCDTTGQTLYPVWLSTYGGPHFPTLANAYRPGGGLEQALVREGFIVFKIDPRSASGKGAKSAWSAYKHLGVQELEDIKDGLAWLKERSYVDGARIGMSGHSYGGYLTAFCMTHSDLFAAGIAGAPVTDWRDYDSIYTERYMDTPQNNPAGYDASSVVKAADQLHGRLLILHGTIDDNVSVRNTMRLVHALQQADKDFELMVYPNARHGIGGAHYTRLQREFIRRNLGGPKPKEAPAAGQ